MPPFCLHNNSPDRRNDSGDLYVFGIFLYRSIFRCKFAPVILGKSAEALRDVFLGLKRGALHSARSIIEKNKLTSVILPIMQLSGVRMSWLMRERRMRLAEFPFSARNAGLREGVVKSYASPTYQPCPSLRYPQNSCRG